MSEKRTIFIHLKCFLISRGVRHCFTTYSPVRPGGGARGLFTNRSNLLHHAYRFCPRNKSRREANLFWVCSILLHLGASGRATSTCAVEGTPKKTRPFPTCSTVHDLEQRFPGTSIVFKLPESDPIGSPSSATREGPPSFAWRKVRVFSRS